jgi:hypothetical protein
MRIIACVAALKLHGQRLFRPDPERPSMEMSESARSFGFRTIARTLFVFLHSCFCDQQPAISEGTDDIG